MKSSAREKKFVRWFIAGLSFTAIGYIVALAVAAYRESASLAAVALGLAGLMLFALQVLAMRNPNWPQKLR